jgi:hypothetical protein
MHHVVWRQKSRFPRMDRERKRERERKRMRCDAPAACKGRLTGDAAWRGAAGARPWNTPGTTTGVLQLLYPVIWVAFVHAFLTTRHQSHAR